jgi:polygalacturonase
LRITDPMFTRRQFVAGIAGTAALRPQKAAAAAGDLLTPQAFGARGNGESLDTQAIQTAIDTAHRNGGGTVRFPAGRYLSGLLALRSNVSLWLDNGAVLTMAPDDRAFAPANTEREGIAYRAALLAGENVESVAVWGEGSIECNRTRRGGPKPIALLRSKRVSLRGISIRNSPNYTISLLGCEDVTIDGINIYNGWADGIDPDCSRRVRISNCFVESVDDAICLKASGQMGERIATEGVAVTNCVLRTASIHFKCGTESCRDFSNIVLANCTFHGDMGMRHGNPGLSFYTVDGGSLRNVSVTNVTMQNVGIPIALRRGTRNRCGGDSAGVLESIRIANVAASGAKLPSVIAGITNAPVRDVRIQGLSVSMSRADSVTRPLAEIPERPGDYPDPTMFGPLPAYLLYVRHASELVLRDVRAVAAAGETRAAIIMDDVFRCGLEGLRAEAGPGPDVWLHDAQESAVRDPEGRLRLRVGGNKSRGLRLAGDIAVTADPDAPSAAIEKE